MATGTGKTRTAIAGIKHLLDTNSSLIVVVATPQNTLTKQWMSEVEALKIGADEMRLVDGTNHNWRRDMTQAILKVGAGFINNCVIFTTHITSSSDAFTSILRENLPRNAKTLFVGDEVHWLGAGKLREALLSDYNYRIGLSATPSRWFDDEGTAVLLSYFGNKNFVFSIYEALTQINPLTGRTFLVNYNYIIRKVGLNDEETDEYKKVTARLTRLAGMKEKNADANLSYQRALDQRANIIKNAEAKYEVLESLLAELEQRNELSNLIIFVSPQQIERVKYILLRRGVVFHKLTEKEGTSSQERYNGLSEREHIIKMFKANEYQAIIAIKCLDEGIDIPCASRGILMSSSTNPREYVQRIGRIIRQDKGKTFATLYDICVSSIDGLSDDEARLERSIKNKEIIRLEDIAENAINSAEALKVILSLKS